VKQVWFTADTHFGHINIPFYAKREFCLDERELRTARSMWENNTSRNKWAPSRESIARMDDHLIGMINKNVDKDDILWHLGDFCFWKKEGLRNTAAKYLERINCKNVFLVSGNHDSDEIKSVFPQCHDYREIKVQSKNIVLSHFAHCFWNRSHHGSWMLYGHAHGNAEDWLDENMPGRRSMDVGVDNAFRILGEYRPFSFPEIYSIMESRHGFHPDKNRFTSGRSTVR
jgi:calcineurin-like phosphoesterase family protein